MSNTGDNNVHVVFVGRKPGIYFTSAETFEQVENFKGSFLKSYDSYDDAEEAYIEYCFFNGMDPGFVGGHVHGHLKMPDYGKRIATLPTTLAVDTSAAIFISQQSMQKLLKKLCFMLKVEQPKLMLHDTITIDGVQYRRYSACVDIGTRADPLVSLGDFAKDDYGAQEDAAVRLAEELCDRSGKKIRDFNFYSLQRLQATVEGLKDENVKLKMKLAMLQESNKGKCGDGRSI